MINYGNTKTVEEREKTLARRQKAWNSGSVPKGHGIHYVIGHNKNWIWDRKELTDVRLTKYNPYVEKLQKITQNIDEWEKN